MEKYSVLFVIKEHKLQHLFSDGFIMIIIVISVKNFDVILNADELPFRYIKHLIGILLSISLVPQIKPNIALKS